jgi:predicted TIM-barrel fold metal-dependent hydrolase
LQRRTFLTRGAAAGLGVLGVSGPRALRADESATSSVGPLRVSNVSQSKTPPIVDTHQHLWDLKRFRLPWQKDAPKLQRSFLPSDYLAATARHNVALTVYMEVDVEVAQQNDEADYVLDLCGRDDNPMAGAVISGRPADEAFPKYMARFRENAHIKGIRQVLHGEGTPAGFCLAPQFVKGIQHLGEIGKSYDLCMRSGELLDADKLVAQCPKTRFIVDHCGNMSVTDTNPAHRAKWLDGMKALAQRDNVVCKVSGIIASAAENWKPADLAPNVLDTIKVFGIDRVMFAGDWPVCTLRAEFGQWVDCLSEIVKEFSETDRRKLFHDNAVAFYKLPKKVWSAK